MEQQSNQQVFALDIGTRSLIGIVGHKEDDLFLVQAYEVLEHPKRAMIDGQIEDIAQVAQVARELKRRLEEKTGIELKRVAVAAAGRALKTARGTCKKSLSGKAIDAQLSYEMESCAVNQAREDLDKEEGASAYHCVGHSVVSANIDGYSFSNLLQHKGNEASVEVIATFLPSEVVSSLRRCMDLLGLEIETLTLEPIAAMRAVLPRDIRLLNLAMVDIGAGTSDIAITRDGSVAAYTMATVAGDEITEAIIRHCLVDFETAEQIKLALSSEETISYTDILGHTHSMTSEAIAQAVEPSVDMLAKVIADKIEQCNQGAPMAVFLVGGGSQTLGLCQKLAENLGIQADKVAVAGTKFSGRVLNKEAGLDAPEHATPVGIALTAAEDIAAGGSLVQVNGKKVRLFIGGEGISVMDVLLLAGYQHADLMGHNGRAVVFSLNGERKVAWGEPHVVAQIRLNGKDSTLNAPVYGDDKIELEVAKSGADAHPTMAEYWPKGEHFTVLVNGAQYTVGHVLLQNGLPVAPENEIEDKAELVFAQIRTVQQFCEVCGMNPKNLVCNGNKIDLLYKLEPEDEIFVDDNEIEGFSPLIKPVEQQNQEIKLEERKKQNLQTKALMDSENGLEIKGDVPDAVFETSSDKTAVEPAQDGETTADTENARKLHGSSLRIQLNGKTVELPPKPDKSMHTIIDVLPLVDIDPQNPKGWVHIRKNAMEAGYVEVLLSGDEVEIAWEE